MQMEGAEFDYIVVGAGSAGSVIAARLSERAEVSVLLIEAGGRDNGFWLKIPVGYGRTIADPRVNWKYMTEPNPALGGRRIYWPRGKTLGGSSSINGLIYIRGQAQDYDQWRQLGNEGWSYDDVLPFFRRAEDQENGEDEYHGSGGPLAVTNLVERNPLCDALIASAEANGIPHNPDFNGARQEGVGYYQATIRNGRRCSTSVAYLNPVKRRPNLTILTETQAERILFDGTRASGLRVRRGGESFAVACRRELILSGGSVNSPQLLMLSGVGAAVGLKALGIEPVADLPGVGDNLQDHYGGQITWRCNQPITMNDIMLSKRKQLFAGLNWLLFRDGPLSVPAGQAGLFTRVSPGAATPDVQFLFQTFSGGYYEDGLFKFSGFANFICPIRPQSRGRLTLASGDPFEAPRLAPNYFAHEADRRIAVEGLKLARRIAATPPLADFISAEHLPGADVRSDDEIEAYFRETGGCVSHQVGTCKMGSDGMAVVDSRLRVHGVQGLRVADASIMPTLISGNTNAATIMIGEKAAQMIAEDA
ncbi:MULTISPECIES: GMC family oxidoreductase [unclassified Sphingomonas]|uniref:GMC family oxidoreductase n=1 Tax=unclassified Sphingomonas TaxID=196159 RepID=UPI0006F6A6A2|nr:MULTISPECIES: choline dehydrogenase [unclassified Sphingomonas]KQX19515.1 choline dehydrogenase [Sphingomonas sp. Root1294]KQY65716.1 choline dehydrogenase [Sphingomonas sp. Root50]KRB94980.1 choline dehydrogenase [Sphingomonas sp. Root720]